MDFGNGSGKMTKGKAESGLAYTLNIMANQWQPTMIYWLGFRPLKKKELLMLLPKLSNDQLSAELHTLQNLRIVNPVKNDEDQYSLTDDGDQLRQLIVSSSLWGLQQQDDNEDLISANVVEPENTASLRDLVKYNDTVEKYLG